MNQTTGSTTTEEAKKLLFKNTCNQIIKGSRVEHYNNYSKRWFKGIIKRIDDKTYSFPIFIVLSDDGYERALTQDRVRLDKSLRLKK